MGTERARAMTATQRPARSRRDADALSTSSSSIDTLISRFRASATANRSAGGESELGEDESNLDEHDTFGDEDDGSTYDESLSLSPIELSPIQPLPRPMVTSGRSTISSSKPTRKADSPVRKQQNKVRSPSSLTRKADPAMPTKKRANMKQASQSHGAFFRRQEGATVTKSEEVSPMPKLTQLPRTKPSLLLKPKTVLSKPNARVSSAPPAKNKSPARPLLPKSPPRTRPRSPSPVRHSSRRISCSDDEPDDDDLLSSLSPPSSDSERATDPSGPNSLNSLIDSDLETLHELISTGKRGNEARRAGGRNVAMKSWTSDDITAVLRQNTRFRSNTNQSTNAVEPAGSSFRLRLDMLTSPTQQKNRSVGPQTTHKGGKAEDADESIVKELSILSESFRKSQELVKKVKKIALPRKPPQVEKASTVEINEETTAKIREASDAIDKALLLALQPFEKIRKRQEQEEAEASDKIAREVKENPITSVVDAELPVASQRIVEQLDLAFGDLTKQRNGELEAIKDAAAAQKKAEEEKQKAEADAKQAAETEKRAQDMEVLRLLPLHGKLLTCSADIDEVLVQMEVMERRKLREPQPQALDDPVSVAGAIMALRIATERRIQAIEAVADGAPKALEKEKESYHDWWEPRQTDLMRQHFDEPEGSSLDSEPMNRREDNNLDELTLPTLKGEFGGIIQRDVVEKLDLTILKLRHVLSIDAKEAEEAAALKAQREQETIRLEKEKAIRDAKKCREEEDAESARYRVMGLTSIDQVHEWIASAAALRTDNMRVAIESPEPALGIGGPLWRSEFDHETELYRFEQLEQIMQSRDMRDGKDDKVRFIDDHVDRFTGYAPSDNQWDVLSEEQDTRPVRNLPARSMQHRRPNSSSASYVPESPVSSRHQHNLPKTAKPSREWSPPIPRPPTATTSSSRPSKRGAELGKHLEETILAFQSDRRAKSKWFKHVAIRQ